MSAQHTALWAMYIPLLSFAASVGGYIATRRARAPFGAPEPPEEIARRQRFRAEHLGQWRVAVVVSAVLSVAAVAVVIILGV